MQSVQFQGQAITPSKIVCVGKNYVAHIEEMNSVIPDEMVVFMKPNSAIDTTLYAALDEPLHYEGEICFLINSGTIAGVGFGLDLTKRGLQAKLKDAGLPWERSKAFNSAALFSAFVPAPASLDRLVVELAVDNEVRQRGGVDLMMYKPADILAELSSFVRLNDGDIVMTGTPSGVGKVEAGQRFTGRVLNGSQELVGASWVAV